MNKTFSNNLKELMIERKIKNKSLAEKIGVSVNTIINYKSGRAMPTLDKALAISDELEVSVADLCGFNEYD